jgi:hypothetical protein
MRRLFLLAIFVGFAGTSIALADSRSDMSAAMAAHADTHPAPAVLPVVATSPRTAAAPNRTQAPARELGRGAAAQAAQNQPPGQAIGLARRAQEAAMSAAGQEQAKAAKQRMLTHPHH